MTDTQQRVAMGYIKGVFGVKGWLKIAANTEHADSLLDYPEWQLSKRRSEFKRYIRSRQSRQWRIAG
jgi:ribosomal 30S subunit maturation factor RimM